MRKRIYEILEVGEDDDIASRAYDLFMMPVCLCAERPSRITVVVLFARKIGNNTTCNSRYEAYLE